MTLESILYLIGGVGISIEVSGGTAVIKLSDGRVFQVPYSGGGISTSEVNGIITINIGGQPFEIPPLQAASIQPIPQSVVTQAVPITQPVEAVSKPIAPEDVGPLVDSILQDTIPESEQIGQLSNTITNSIQEAISSGVPLTPQDVDSLTRSVLQAVVEPLPSQKASIFPDKIFGIPSILLLGGVALALLMKR